MLLQNLINRDRLVACGPSARMREIAQLMRDSDVGSVVICENDRPVGIITDRDIATRCIAECDSSEQCRAKDHMSSPVTILKTDAGIHDIIALMKEREVRRVVIVDTKGVPRAVVSHGDILELLGTEMVELVQGTGPEREKLVSAVA